MASRTRGAHFGALTLTRCVLGLSLGLALMLSNPSGWGQEGRKLVKKVDPVYPDLARKMNLTGTVKVEVIIAADGTVGEVKPLGGNPVLVAAVEDAVKQWRYASGPAETKKLEFKF